MSFVAIWAIVRKRAAVKRQTFRGLFMDLRAAPAGIPFAL
jgi:hypothetical protein